MIFQKRLAAILLHEKQAVLNSSTYYHRSPLEIFFYHNPPSILSFPLREALEIDSDVPRLQGLPRL